MEKRTSTLYEEMATVKDLQTGMAADIAFTLLSNTNYRYQGYPIWARINSSIEIFVKIKDENEKEFCIA